jgi:hypothetical protein
MFSDWNTTMKLRSLSVLFLSIALGLLANTALATIKIEKGTYQVPALLVRSKSGVAAVFNSRSLSELRLHLKGPAADQLTFKEFAVMTIKFSVASTLFSSEGEATLINATPVGGKKVPIRVGNNFKPTK